MTDIKRVSDVIPLLKKSKETLEPMLIHLDENRWCTDKLEKFNEISKQIDNLKNGINAIECAIYILDRHPKKSFFKQKKQKKSIPKDKLENGT